MNPAAHQVLEERITRTIGRYASGAVAIAVIAGVTQGTAAWLIGVPFALALGIVAGLLGLIPQIGATLAAIVLSLVALTQGVPQALIMLAVCIGYQQIENYVLQPTIQGRAVDISGFFVIASVIVGAALLGVVGALIAVPIVASAQIVIRELTEERREASSAHASGTPSWRLPRRAARLARHSSAAVVAGAAEDDVVLLHRVAEAARGPCQRALERLVGERLDLPAVVADEVVMVVVALAVPARSGRRRRRCRPAVRAAARRACRARGRRSRLRVATAARADPVVDLLRGAAAVLRGEVLDDRLARAAASQTRSAEPGERVVGPRRPCSK